MYKMLADNQVGKGCYWREWGGGVTECYNLVLYLSARKLCFHLRHLTFPGCLAVKPKSINSVPAGY